MDFEVSTTTTIHECNDDALITVGAIQTGPGIQDTTTEEIETTRFQGAQTPEYVEGETFTFQSASPRPFRHIDGPMTAKTPEFITSPKRVEDGPSSASYSFQDVELSSNTETCSSPRFISSHPPSPPGICAAESTGEVSPTQRTSKKRKRNRGDMDGVSGFLDLEAEVSHDEEDDEGDEDMDGFIVGDDEDASPSINYHAITTKLRPDEERISKPSIPFVDFGKKKLDSRTYNYVDKVMMTLYNEPNSEAAERREKTRQKHGLQSIWLVYVHSKRQRDVICWWKEFCKTFRTKRPADCDVTLYARRPKDNFLYVETQNPALTALALSMCRHVVRSPTGLNGIKMVQMDVYETPLSLQLLIEHYQRAALEHSTGSWVCLYTNPPHKVRKNECRYTTPPPPPSELPDATWSISEEELATNAPPEEPIACKDETRDAIPQHTHSKHSIPPETLKRCDSLRHYHGDAAIVVSSGCKELTVLLIPRVPVKAIQTSGAYQVSLHDEVVQCLHDVESLSREFLSTCRYNVDHGLRVEVVSTEFVKPLHRPLTPREGMLFYSCSHPILTDHFPRVAGWDFQVGERVVTRISGILGEVVAVEQDGLYTVDTDNIRRHVGWGVQKSWKTGDLVQHTIHGWDGFVVEQSEFHGCGHLQTLVHTRNIMEIQKGSCTLKEKEHIQVLVEPNFLVRYTPPQRSIFSQSVPSIPWMEAAEYQTSFLKTDPKDVRRILAEKHPELLTPAQIDREVRNGHVHSIPWMFREVDVFSRGYRGRARVTDVRYGCQTASGLMIQVEWIVQGSVGDRFEVDYDFVLDLDSQMPLHVVEAAQPPFVVRVGYSHPKFNPPTYYGSSSSSRYLHEPDSRLHSSSWACDIDNDPSDEETGSIAEMRDRIMGRTSYKHIAISDELVIDKPATRPMPVVTPEDIQKMLKFLESPVNVRCRRTWSDDAHPSHRWLYELQGKPARLLFWVKLFGKDDQFRYTFKGLERTVKVGYTELGDRCIFYRHEKQDRILPNAMRIEMRGIAVQTKKALYVLKGDHAGEYAVRIATVPRNLASQSEAMYACCSVDSETGAVDANVEYKLRASDVCQIELEKEAFTRMDKEAQEIKEKKGVQRNQKRRKTTET
ncbi:hypothetical protein VNI00_014245 [Paramarasmius palmivorus]|uniref:Uncharacterized protein n=1 Tax=Paramarasmius palmivorus TaxID=297713 RepID=A0AAW0BWF8_9AGAR